MEALLPVDEVGVGVLGMLVVMVEQVSVLGLGGVAEPVEEAVEEVVEEPAEAGSVAEKVAELQTLPGPPPGVSSVVVAVLFL